MLIGLHFEHGTSEEEKEEIGTTLAKLMGRRCRVVEPQDLKDFFNLVRKYKAGPKRESLVLIKTHYDWQEKIPEGSWRGIDLEFNRRGGGVYGVGIDRDQTTYRRTLEIDNYEHMIDEALYYESRAEDFTVTPLNGGYFGRTDSDPHTLLIGHLPLWFNPSAVATTLLSGLPTGSEEPWWQGVGFVKSDRVGNIPVEEMYQKVLDKFPYAARVSLMEKTHGILDEMGVEYQKASHPPVVCRDPEAEKYGRELRSLARIDMERVVE